VHSHCIKEVSGTCCDVRVECRWSAATLFWWH